MNIQHSHDTQTHTHNVLMTQLTDATTLKHSHDTQTQMQRTHDITTE